MRNRKLTDKVAKWLPFTASTQAQTSVALTASVSNVFHFDDHGEQEAAWHWVQKLALSELALQEIVKERERGGLASEPGPAIAKPKCQGEFGFPKPS